MTDKTMAQIEAMLAKYGKDRPSEFLADIYQLITIATNEYTSYLVERSKECQNESPTPRG